MTHKPPDLVLYHGGGCADGFCSAWIAARALKCPASALLPVNYGQPPPCVQGKRVLIADFCYPREVLFDLVREAEFVTVLDHHKTAALDLFGPDVVWPCVQEQHCERYHLVFDGGKSGARLTWEHFHPGEPAPKLVDYVEDRDLRRWALPFSREINAALHSYRFDLGLWDSIRDWLASHSGSVTLANEGTAILRYQQALIEQHVKHAVTEEIDGHRVPVVNATTLSSEIGERLAREAPFGVTWFLRSDGKRVYSLRSRPDGVDVSEVARQHGGGGHTHAAGFQRLKEDQNAPITLAGVVL